MQSIFFKIIQFLKLKKKEIISVADLNLSFSDLGCSKSSNDTKGKSNEPEICMGIDLPRLHPRAEDLDLPSQENRTTKEPSRLYPNGLET